MKLIRTSAEAFIIIFVIFLLGCGSVSAPPVELPAPITGRVDVSAPDASGNVTITGTEGAVTEDNIVMVVDETLVGTVSMRILNNLIQAAYAADGDLPSICTETGHACALATSDGSFTVIIPASVGDSLAIGLINKSGKFISDLLRVVVPESGTPSPSENCLSEGVTGAVVDIKIAFTGGIPVMLKQGSATTTNQLVVGYPSSTTVSISGCYAHSLDILHTALGDMIAVTSKEDKILWAGRLVNGEVRDSRHFKLGDEPMHIAYVDLPTQPIIALKTSDTVKLARISTSEGNIMEEMIIVQANAIPVSGLTRSLKLDVVPLSVSFGHYLGLLITDDGNSANSYLTLFQADGIVHKGTWSRSEINAVNPLPGADSFVDAILYKAGPAPYMYIALLDSGLAANALRRYNVKIDPAKPLPYNDDLSAIPSLYAPELEFELNWGMGAMKKIVLSEAISNSPRAIMSDASGNLLLQLLSSALPIQAVSVWASGHDIVAIDLNDEMQKLFGADATDSAILDKSSAIPW
jgi:hypothetical protein